MFRKIFLRRNNDFLLASYCKGFATGKKGFANFLNLHLPVPEQPLPAIAQHFADEKHPPLFPPNLSIQELGPNDEAAKEDALQLLLDQFLFDEPLSKYLEFTKEQAMPFYRGKLIDAVSVLVRNSETNNKVVGVYLNQILRRDQPAPNLYGDNKNYSPNVAKFCQIVHVCESNIWSILPEHVVQVCNNVFMSVHRDYQRFGIGFQMAEIIDRKLRLLGGTQAAVAELSAVGTQKIARNLGYFPLLEIPYAGWLNEQGQPIVEADAGAECLQLVCKPYWS